MSRVTPRKTFTEHIFSAIPGVMLLLVLSGGYAAYKIFEAYERGFNGETAPKSIQERTAELRKEAHEDAAKLAKHGGKKEFLKNSEANVTDGKAKDENPDVSARAEWGQLGDYFGGTLNPVFGFISVLALFLTIIYQSREMKLSTEELRNSGEALRSQNDAIRLQSFEQTFFSWLGTYRELLESIEETVTYGEESPVQYRGRRVLWHWWKRYLHVERVSRRVKKEVGDPEWEAVLMANRGAKTFPILLAVNSAFPGAVPKAGAQAWEALYAEAEYQLDSLFRILYRLLQWIDSQSEESLNAPQKWLYVSIVRSQLSWIEMVFLFYNGHSARGAKFKVLAERYALFDNLTFGSDPVISIMKESPPDGKGYELTAYSSSAARRAIGLPEGAEETLRMAALRG